MKIEPKEQNLEKRYDALYTNYLICNEIKFVKKKIPVSCNLKDFVYTHEALSRIIV